MAVRTFCVDDLKIAAGVVDCKDVRSTTFTFGGETDEKTYEIDLNPANARRLRECVDYWAAYARRVPTDRQAPTDRRAHRGTGLNSAANRTAQNRRIRYWANQHGFRVGTRGRIPAHILAAYAQAHRPAQPPKPGPRSTVQVPKPAPKRSRAVKPPKPKPRPTVTLVPPAPSPDGTQAKTKAG